MSASPVSIESGRRPTPSHRAEALRRIAAGLRAVAEGVEGLAVHQAPALEAGTGPELSVEQALAYMPGRSRRWLLDATRGLPFRRDVTLRVKTFEARGFHRWRQGVSR